MAILMCRNLKVIPQIVKMDFLYKVNLKHTKIYLFVWVSIICICNMRMVWKYSAPDTYKEDMESIIEYIESTDYGYALASHWIYGRMSAMSNGKAIFFSSEAAMKRANESAQAAYIVTSSVGFDFTCYDHCEDRFSMMRYYCPPDEIINYDELTLCVYENGIRRRYCDLCMKHISWYNMP